MSSLSRPRLRRRRAGAGSLALVLAVFLAGAACDRGGSGDKASVDADAAASTKTTAHDHSSHDHGEPGSDYHRPEVNPCGLVTKADAGRILGPIASIEEGALGVVSDQRVCGMMLEADPRTGANLGVTDHEASRKFDALRQRFSIFAVEVPSDGDRAIWIKQFRLVLLQKGSNLITVQMTQPSGDATEMQTRAVDLANLAAKKLPAGSGKK